MVDKKQIIKDRESGMTCQQVAEKHGITKQRVSKIVNQRTPKAFKPITEEQCIYPNLRKWMNDKEFTISNLLYRMYFAPEGRSVDKLRRIMRGETVPKKDWIDAMIEATGMSYERLFSEKAWGGKNGK